MRRRGNIISIFVIFFLLAVSIFFLSQKGLLNGVSGMLEMVTVPIQRSLFGVSHKLTTGSESDQVKKLREENQQLTQQLVKEKEIEKENTALHDQFQNTTPAAKDLVSAHIIAMNGFLPGVSRPGELLIDEGADAHITKGAVVVVKNNFIGIVTDISTHAAKVALLTQEGTSFTAQTLKTSALGIVKSQDSDVLLLDNVVLSDKLEKDDLVVTKGDSSTTSQIPAGLVVGKIISVNKKTSNLFQTALVQSLVDVTQLEMVFLIRAK